MEQENPVSGEDDVLGLEKFAVCWPPGGDHHLGGLMRSSAVCQ